MRNLEIWLKGLAAAAVAGAANGIITGFAAVGIDPVRFNLRAGFVSTLAISAVSALMSAIIGAAAYLKQSPLPATPDPITDAGVAGLPGRPLSPDWRPGPTPNDWRPGLTPPDSRQEDPRFRADADRRGERPL